MNNDKKEERVPKQIFVINEKKRKKCSKQPEMARKLVENDFLNF